MASDDSRRLLRSRTSPRDHWPDVVCWHLHYASSTSCAGYLVEAARFAARSLAKEVSGFLPYFRMSLALLPESNIVALALSQSAMLGLPQKDAARLQGLCGERYAKIHADPVFGKVPSALPYCYAAEKPREGLATVYVPRGAGSNSPSPVFLHGYGGSFLWDQHLLAEAFPDHLIICPAFGNAPTSIPSGYVTEAVAQAERRLGYSLSRPILCGLSAGVWGAMRVYLERPVPFRRLVVIAAYPLPEMIARFKPPMEAYFIAGSREPFVQSGQLSRAVSAILARGINVESHAVANADHYFLLTHREEALKIMSSCFKGSAKP